MHRYEKPTAIQAQALPAALSGRDVLVRLSPTYLHNIPAITLHISCPSGHSCDDAHVSHIGLLHYVYS